MSNDINRDVSANGYGCERAAPACPRRRMPEDLPSYRRAPYDAAYAPKAVRKHLTTFYYTVRYMSGMHKFIGIELDMTIYDK